ncbi:hypothetical protein [Arvimicrobium flavum]|uniref:hypothetical protein n=1 Tax=Arvimicrobium flavum TaxID=3393320 RepID=UPI00237B6906|nr:hypothetical protein [Mesorhizobium shangrilense]
MGGRKRVVRGPYRVLDPEQIIRTARLLDQRVADRFPDSGLRKVSSELVTLACDLAREAKVLEAPIWWLRLLIGAGIVAGGAIFLFVGTFVPLSRLSTGAFDSVQGLESTINTMLLATLGLLALVRSEEHIKRRQVFRSLHGLRSLIHVVDMHQLTKDPMVLSPEFKAATHSPPRITDPAELARYLDYCSEMLSITGKIAALFAQSVNDAVVVEAVNDIEELGSNLSRKIWQKITMIDQRSLAKAG